MNINNINVNKYPISQILDPESKTIYEIPKYQREYIWGTKQWEELFNDLMENGTGYFLGSIICINTNNRTQEIACSILHQVIKQFFPLLSAPNILSLIFRDLINRLRLRIKNLRDRILVYIDIVNIHALTPLRYLF